ncbi:hypothetical protein HOD29_04975 [archaeon]|jgi:hypothetical protein|nr:hypothetical protein [archaeon]
MEKLIIILVVAFLGNATAFTQVERFVKEVNDITYVYQLEKVNKETQEYRIQSWKLSDELNGEKIDSTWTHLYLAQRNGNPCEKKEVKGSKILHVYTNAGGYVSQGFWGFQKVDNNLIETYVDGFAILLFILVGIVVIVLLWFLIKKILK